MASFLLNILSVRGEDTTVRRVKTFKREEAPLYRQDFSRYCIYKSSYSFGFS